MINKKIIVVGYSGHSYVVIESALLQGITITSYSEKERTVSNPFQLNYLGDEGEQLFKGWQDGNKFILGIGNNLIRTRIGSLISSKGFDVLNVFHPSAFISPSSEKGKGNFIGVNAIINPFAKIGDYNIINSSAVVEHECILEDGVHIAPGAVLGGSVKVGSRSFIGANAAVKEGIVIGADVIIGAGSVILEDVQDGVTVVGNPGKAL